jgi:oligoribonuclease
MDMEMTGLDPEVDRVLEIAVVVTDSELNILDESLDMVIHQPSAVLNSMNSWCKKQHGKSGLTKKCLESKISLSEAKREVLKMVRKYCEKKTGLLCGNSIHADRKFLKKYFPRVDSYLNYRMIDVTSVKELAKRWYAKEAKVFLSHKEEDVSHRALDDIKYSINELKFYRETIFK